MANTLSTSDLSHGMQVTISGRRTFEAKDRLRAMGLKWSPRLSAWTGTIDDPTGNHLFALGKYASGLTITVATPSSAALDSWYHETAHGAELTEDK